MSDNITALWTKEANLKWTREMWVSRIDRFSVARDENAAKLAETQALRNGFDADLFVKRIADADAKLATAFAALEVIDEEYATVLDQIYTLAWEVSE